MTHSPGALRSEHVSRLAGARVGVVGDLVADVYISGLTERISREAPVPVVRFEKQWLVPGGAANVALNIAAVGAEAVMVGLAGDDDAGRDLTAALEGKGVRVEGIVRCAGRSTTTKTRMLAGARHTIRQQLVRLDHEPCGPPAAEVRREFVERVRTLDDHVDAWIASDYGYQSFDAELKGLLRAVAKGKPVLADSRFDTLGFSGVTVIKPNEEEAIAATSITGSSLEEMRSAARELSERLDVEAVLITLGNQGMLLHERGGKDHHLPAVGTDEIVDLTGAGDTVAAIFTTAMAVGLSRLVAAQLSNHAAGVVVMKEGAATTTIEELARAIDGAEAAPACGEPPR